MKQSSPKKPSIHTKRARLWRVAATLLLAGVLLYVIGSNRATAGKSIQVIGHAHAGWLAASIGCSVLTFLIAAAIYVQLALHSLRYGQTLLIELAASFANRLLPAGLGGLGLHGLYLHKRRHTPAEATAIVSVNNLLGITAHVSLLIVVCVFQPKLISQFTDHWQHVPWLAVVVALTIVAVVIGLVPRLRRVLLGFGNNLGISFRRLSAGSIGRAYILAVVLTGMYTLTLLASAHAVGISLGILQIFIVFSIGMLAGTATPTPGGLVGIEAGLYAGLVSYNVPMVPAGAAVVLYRLITYWLPLLPGFAALLLVRKRTLV